MITPDVQKYSEQLTTLGIAHEILEHPELTAVEDVQKYLGFGLDGALATLIMKTEDGFIAVIRRGDCTLDNKKIKKILGVESLRMATDSEFTQLTGVVPGAAHILHNVQTTLIDAKVLEKKSINGGSGSLQFTFRYQSADLLKIPHSQVAEISKLAVTTVSEGNTVQRVFSGIRATGRLHLGNYLGAVKGMLELQNSNEYETLYMVADTHTITTPYQIEELRKNRREVIIDYLAAGLDPEKSIIFQQAEVNEHIELAFYFSSVVSIARMQHLPTFKEKVKQHPHGNTMALLNYPILMASDILVYKAGLVPVGIDQEPHLEAAREIARKMNEQYDMDFPEPVRFATKGEYIPSLKGQGKMSKSIEGSYINLTDSKEEVKKKIRSIPTATSAGGEMSEGVKTLFTFARLFIPDKLAQFESEFQNGTLKFVEIKDAVAEAVTQELEPLQKRREELESNPSYIDKVIREGTEKARAVARKTVNEVKNKMGLG